MRFKRVGMLAAAMALALSACTDEPGPPEPPPSQEPPAFVVATTVPVRNTDPVTAAGGADQDFVVNVFQTLMKVPPGAQVLKPDLATDCGFFDGVLIYTCTLDPEAKFADGKPLTADDVAFSIERSRRLHPVDGPGSLWGSLDKIEVVDKTTVRFRLTRPDSQFGFALATPGAAIVPKAVYPPDKVLDNPAQTLGSGPYRVTSYRADRVEYEANEHYAGDTPARVLRVEVPVYPDSASVEEAMRAGEVQAVWRGLSSQAHTRMARQIEANGEHTDGGFARITIAGGRVHRLMWQDSSSLGGDPVVRRLVRDALQDERTLDSIVPPQLPGHRSSFVEGGQPDLAVPPGEPRELRLVVEPTAPDATDQASTVRSRLEETGALRVTVVDPGEPADLVLTDDPAPNSTAIAWARPYLDRPTHTTVTPLMLLRIAYGEATDEATRDTLMGRIQAMAALDATVVPVWQSDEHLYIGQGYVYDTGEIQPGWQLGFWGFRTIG
ncbi:ABC transporter substrate-binding protein [Enemella sp. A6]|uniref:ABC transporter substrate-binding protein n=1 Tax=Enemella sp. A6 TaxID=3440152 RepID=UPI003EC00427